jgi:hypothetical protein
MNLSKSILLLLVLVAMLFSEAYAKGKAAVQSAKKVPAAKKTKKPVREPTPTPEEESE